MTKNNSVYQHNFWSGLSLGVLFGASSLFLLGTKKGRLFLKHILEATEDLEGLTEDVMQEVRTHLDEVKPRTIEERLEAPGGTIENVIDKIQSVLPEKKDLKSFFTKDGKVLK